MNKSEYKSLTEWKQADLKAYNNARTKGLLQEICDEFGWENTSIYPYGRARYTKEQIIQIARNSDSLHKFRRDNAGANTDAEFYGISYQVKCSIGLDKPKKITYNKKYILALANDFEYLHSFETKHKYAYRTAVKKGWLPELEEKFRQKEWNRLKEVRAFGAFTQTEEFNKAFEEFKNTYIE